LAQEVSKMGKARKRRRLLRVVIASGLLVVAVPSVAAAHEHLTPVDALDRGRQAGVDTAWANLVEPLSLRADFYSRLYNECSMDPRDPALIKPGARMCRNDQALANEVPTGQERADIQHLVPEGNERVAAIQVPTGQERAEIQHLVPEGNEGIDQAPAPSDRTEIEFWWGMVGIVVAAGGVVGLIVGLRRGRPHAFS
jgi:hypothetical protein